MTSPELPEGFRFLGQEWTIIIDTDVLNANGNYAEMRRDNFEIALNGSTAKHHRESLMHELVHVTGIPLGVENHSNETIVAVLAANLYALLADNPELRRYIWPED